mmetsp:Transcript_31751/g.82856  ORF Transcript_31751/g.82856 Transcript_31751/m.82856 type:complete len:112 (-) Transcript_31751:37-372(-)
MGAIALNLSCPAVSHSCKRKRWPSICKRFVMNAAPIVAGISLLYTPSTYLHRHARTQVHIHIQSVCSQYKNTHTQQGGREYMRGSVSVSEGVVGGGGAITADGKKSKHSTR